MLPRSFKRVNPAGLCSCCPHQPVCSRLVKKKNKKLYKNLWCCNTFAKTRPLQGEHRLTTDIWVGQRENDNTSCCEQIYGGRTRRELLPEYGLHGRCEEASMSFGARLHNPLLPLSCRQIAMGGSRGFLPLLGVSFHRCWKTQAGWSFVEICGLVRICAAREPGRGAHR